MKIYKSFVNQETSSGAALFWVWDLSCWRLFQSYILFRLFYHRLLLLFYLLFRFLHNLLLVLTYILSRFLYYRLLVLTHLFYLLPFCCLLWFRLYNFLYFLFRRLFRLNLFALFSPWTEPKSALFFLLLFWRLDVCLFVLHFRLLNFFDFGFFWLLLFLWCIRWWRGITRFSIFGGNALKNFSYINKSIFNVGRFFSANLIAFLHFMSFH